MGNQFHPSLMRIAVICVMLLLFMPGVSACSFETTEVDSFSAPKQDEETGQVISAQTPEGAKATATGMPDQVQASATPSPETEATATRTFTSPDDPTNIENENQETPSAPLDITPTTELSTRTQPDVNAMSPQRLGIYYGWPSAAVNDGHGALSPYQLLSQFSVIVLGEGLADPGHPDHIHTVTLLEALTKRGAEVYGYVDMGISTRAQPVTFADLEAEVAQWRDIGATGIFWDDAGFEYASGLDYSSYRQRVIELVELTHAYDLSAFLNAWDPDDLFFRRTGDQGLLPALPLTDRDIVLAESWVVSEGEFVEPIHWYRKALKLASYRQGTPFRLACVATGMDGEGLEETGEFQAAYWAAVLQGCDFFQFTNAHYSAQVSEAGNHLYVYEMPSPDVGDTFVGAIQIGRNGKGIEFSRNTDRGIVHVGFSGAGQGYGYFLPGDETP